MGLFLPKCLQSIVRVSFDFCIVVKNRKRAAILLQMSHRYQESDHALVKDLL